VIRAIVNKKQPPKDIKRLISGNRIDFAAHKKIPLKPSESNAVTPLAYINNQLSTNCKLKNLLVVNESSAPGGIRPEIIVGRAGGLNYALSFIKTPYLSLVDDFILEAPDCDCLIGFPGDISGLWEKREIPKIIYIRTEIAEMIGFNWDLKNTFFIEKEFIFHVAVNFNVKTKCLDSYHLEDFKDESYQIRMELLELYPEIFSGGGGPTARRRVKPFNIKRKGRRSFSLRLGR